MKWPDVLQFLPVFYILSTSEYFVRNFYSGIVYFGFAYSVSRRSLELFYQNRKINIKTSAAKDQGKHISFNKILLKPKLPQMFINWRKESKLDELTLKWEVILRREGQTEWIIT